MKESNTKETKNAAPEKSKGGHGSGGRIFAGIFLMYLIYGLIILPIAIVSFVLFEYATSEDYVLACLIPSIYGLLLFLYCYAFLGDWLFEFASVGVTNVGGARNPVLRVIGNIFGAIGEVLRPYPIMAYGANKKIYLYFAVVIPHVFIGAGCIAAGVLWGYPTFFIYSGIVAFINALCVISIKKCPKCGCVMSKIDYKSVSCKSENYTKERSVDIGSVGGETLYLNYNQEYHGTRETFAKTFTCLNCGTERQGRGFSVSSRDYGDRY